MNAFMIATIANRTGADPDRLTATWPATRGTDLQRIQQLETWATGNHTGRDLSPDWRLARALLRHRRGTLADPGRTVKFVQTHARPGKRSTAAGVVTETYGGVQLAPGRIPLHLDEHKRGPVIGEVVALVADHLDTAVYADIAPGPEGDALLAGVAFGDRPDVGISWGVGSRIGAQRSNGAALHHGDTTITEVTVTRTPLRPLSRPAEIVTAAEAKRARTTTAQGTPIAHIRQATHPDQVIHVGNGPVDMETIATLMAAGYVIQR